jgi:hypothetical protein
MTKGSRFEAWRISKDTEELVAPMPATALSERRILWPKALVEVQ